MVSRTDRESKAQSTHAAAMKIIEAEQNNRRLKIARLRELRLANQAEVEEPHGPQVAK